MAGRCFAVHPIGPEFSQYTGVVPSIRKIRGVRLSCHGIDGMSRTVISTIEQVVETRIFLRRGGVVETIADRGRRYVPGHILSGVQMRLPDAHHHMVPLEERLQAG